MTATQDALSRLDEQIQMLQKLRDLAANPIAFEAMRQLALNGSATSTTHAIVRIPDLKVRRQGVKEDILAACRRLTEPFRVQDVWDAMVRENYEFGMKDIRSAISSNLQKLADSGEIEIVKRGSGSVPSVYRNTPAEVVAANRGDSPPYSGR